MVKTRGQRDQKIADSLSTLEKHEVRQDEAIKQVDSKLDDVLKGQALLDKRVAVIESKLEV